MHNWFKRACRLGLKTIYAPHPRDVSGVKGHQGPDWFLSLPSLARTGDAGHRWPGSRGARTFCLVLAIASLFSCKQTGCLGLCTVASEAMGKTIISCVSREPGSEWPFASDEPGLLLSAGNQSSSLCICQIQGKLRLLKSNH